MHRRQFIQAAIGSSAAVIAGQASGIAPLIGRAAAQNGDEQRVVTVARLNLRSGPGLGRRVVTVLDRGDIVSVISATTSADGYEWVKVAVWGTSLNGWVVAAYIGSDSGGGGSFAPGSTVRVAVDRLNLRSGPGLGNGVVRTYRRGTSARVRDNAVLRDGYTWIPVQVSDGTRGWFAATHLR